MSPSAVACASVVALACALACACGCGCGAGGGTAARERGIAPEPSARPIASSPSAASVGASSPANALPKPSAPPPILGPPSDPALEDAPTFALLDAGVPPGPLAGAPTGLAAPPRLVTPLSCPFPAAAIEDEARVRALVAVDATGAPTRVDVAAGAGAPFDAQARACLSTARFVPARGRDGAAVAGTLVVIVDFAR